ncbi:MAG: hypothetical protein R2825_02790 [Saprospiraceae bacterium]
MKNKKIENFFIFFTSLSPCFFCSTGFVKEPSFFNNISTFIFASFGPFLEGIQENLQTQKT